MPTNVQEFISELYGGVFEEKVAAALSEVALGVVNTGKKGRVSIELNIAQVANSYQVEISHTLTFKRPTERGEVAQKDTTESIMHVGKRGDLSVFPENQADMFNPKDKEAK
ncbi:hypothetical protein EUZ85_19440 [Hahella sp. KA22]|uniref:Uncharacterized protein n=1 Tax=Hahella chejuensis (strain KCTC 2396) TaxID=349521 RepID=Q2SI85_HAHCH|nr:MULTISPECIES: hypothetical protein [Hahella]ABC29639.1 conserved hypothetical protein [Hahella chejuensis KCTC 2396]AZZ92778.1 hypothetical protein ENC22_16860 [Hahella sp. KA22]MBU6954567.1 hypothetical protein [Hahella sp. HN01]QAY56152.1 hypothetical protein EUZ85_19440 [Hahella sp. KA22]